MSNRRSGNAGQIEETVNRLSQQLSTEPQESAESVLQSTLHELIRSEPFTAAAIRSGPTEAGRSQWTWMDSAETGRSLLNQLADEQPDLLTRLQQTQQPVQYDFDDLMGEPTTEGRCYFIGLPAGRMEDEPSMVGILSEREVSDGELERLASVSRLLGLAAENARLTGLLSPNDGQSPVANLIGLIAHELRTPLTGMRGNIQLAMMSNQKGQTERVPERLEAAIIAVDNMASLVQKLLDVSRLERGNFPLHPTRANLRITVSEAIDAALGEPDPAGTLIQLADGDAVHHVHDQRALQAALTNLLTTVLNYREVDRPVDVQLLAHPESTTIEITYHGAQLSTAEQVALASPLYERHPRLSSSNAQDLSLELAYSRGVVSHHEGVISIDRREANGDEHLITVRLPVDYPA